MIHYELLNGTKQEFTQETVKAIERGLQNAEHKLGDIGDRHLVVEFVTPAESARINKALRQKNDPTDIISISSMETAVGEQVITQKSDGSLSFDLHQDSPIAHDWPVLGQLVLCWEIIVENAKQAGQPPERELEWIIEHGVLHVLGFHHE